MTILLFSCSNNCNRDEISLLFEDWIKVESAIEESQSNKNDETDLFTVDEMMQNFEKDYNTFRSSDLCKNLLTYKSSENVYSSLNVGEILINIENGITSKDYNLIRSSVFLLEQYDKLSTFKSNKEYMILCQILVLICIFITVILFISVKQYEKKKVEACQIGDYSLYMIKGIESERNRISKDIHDTILQDIRVMELKASMLDTENGSNNIELKQELITGLRYCLKSLRQICNNLTPSEFKHTSRNINGFEIALKNLTSQFTERSGINCILRIQDNVDISQLDMKDVINIFRIIQEALNNIEKHSQATNASVVISSNNTNESKKSIKVFITDDGIGFDVSKSNKNHSGDHSHFGLTNMKDRCRQLGGNLEILSEIGDGTEINLEVPLK